MTADTTETATAAHAELVYLNPVEAEIEPNQRLRDRLRMVQGQGWDRSPTKSRHRCGTGWRAAE